LSYYYPSSYKRFPTDEEFKSQFPQVPIYNLRITDYTLRKLENFQRRKEPISIDNYTIEHIMPQKEDLSEEWIKELGNDWNKIHEKYLHTIGNLTLTGYNSELGYLSFKEKRDTQGGFASSPLWLNSNLAKLEHWTKDEIDKRAKELADHAVKIWSMPDLSVSVLQKYKEKEESIDMDIYTEEDHFENGSEHTKRLYEILKPIILSIASDIRLIPKKKYIAFLHDKNFVDIVFYKSQLNLYLNVKKGELNDPKGITKDVSPPGHGHWGNGDYVLILRNSVGIEDILPLIGQSYDED
jgi:predicted transport protein